MSQIWNKSGNHYSTTSFVQHLNSAPIFYTSPFGRLSNTYLNQRIKLTLCECVYVSTSMYVCMCLCARMRINVCRHNCKLSVSGHMFETTKFHWAHWPNLFYLEFYTHKPNTLTISCLYSHHIQCWWFYARYQTILMPWKDVTWAVRMAIIKGTPLSAYCCVPLSPSDLCLRVQCSWCEWKLSLATFLWTAWLDTSENISDRMNSSMLQVVNMGLLLQPHGHHEKPIFTQTSQEMP